jgi:hypothetical protein
LNELIEMSFSKSKYGAAPTASSLPVALSSFGDNNDDDKLYDDNFYVPTKGSSSSRSKSASKSASLSARSAPNSQRSDSNSAPASQRSPHSSQNVDVLFAFDDDDDAVGTTVTTRTDKALLDLIDDVAVDGNTKTIDAAGDRKASTVGGKRKSGARQSTAISKSKRARTSLLRAHVPISKQESTSARRVSSAPLDDVEFDDVRRTSGALMQELGQSRRVLEEMLYCIEGLHPRNSLSLRLSRYVANEVVAALTGACRLQRASIRHHVYQARASRRTAPAE